MEVVRSANRTPIGPGSPGDVYCFDSVDEYNAFFNGTIEFSGIEMTGNFTDQSDIDALLAQADTMQKKYVELGKKCQEHSDGKYLKYIGTAATVRDLVALVDALDGPEAPINYLGYSYGTILGSWLVNSTCSSLILFESERKSDRRRRSSVPGCAYVPRECPPG